MAALANGSALHSLTHRCRLRCLFDITYYGVGSECLKPMHYILASSLQFINIRCV